MSELKPCPFCGCTDNFIEVTSNPFSNDIYSTTHCKCYATGPFIAENYLTGEKVPTREFMETRASEQWNTRPIEDALNARIAELEAEQRWIPVSERLPKEEGWYYAGVLGRFGDHYTHDVYFYAEDAAFRWKDCEGDKVYCWLDGVPELPELPEERKCS